MMYEKAMKWLEKYHDYASRWSVLGDLEVIEYIQRVLQRSRLRDMDMRK